LEIKTREQKRYQVKFWNKEYFPTILFLPFIVAFCFGLYLGVLICFSQVSSYRGIEENVVYSIQQVVSNNPLYNNPEKIPFSITQYPPLYYLLCAAVVKALSITPGKNVIEIYQVCRIISLFCSLSLSSLLYWISRKILSLSSILSLIIFVISFLVPQPWFFLVRPDAMESLLLMISIALFLLTLKHQDDNLRRGLFLFACGIFCCLTFLAKQNGLIIFVLLIGFEIIRFKFKNALIIGLGSIFAIITTSIIFHPYYSFFPFSSELIYMNIIKGINNGISFKMAKTFYQLYFFENLPLILVAFISILIFLNQKHRNENSLFLYFVFIFISVLSLFSMGKIGSAEHYMIDAVLISLLFIGISANKMDHINRPKFIPLIMSILYVLSLIFCISNLIERYQRYGTIAYNSYQEKNYYDNKLISYFDKVFLEDPSIYLITDNRLLNNYFYDKVVLPQREIVDCCTYPLKTFDYSDFQGLVDKMILKYLVIPEGLQLRNYLGVDLVNFSLIETMNGYDIYINNPSH